MADVQAGLMIAVLIGILIALYHLIFIAVDLRKVIRRAERLTGEVESVVHKPLAVTDKLLKWVIHFIEAATEEHQQHHRKKK
jgi:hypothetical protein